MSAPRTRMPRAALSQREFVALMGLTSASVAFSIDAMLPAFPAIAAELSPHDLNAPQLLITAFVLGMGLGTFFAGPLADAMGRKPVLILGMALYALAAFFAWMAPTLDNVVAARFVQGFAVAAPRVVAMAMTRDLYSGREMARILSFIMIVFTIVPAIAPSIGALIIALFGWRDLFLAFIVFALCISVWLGLRQPETLAPQNRRQLSVTAIGWALIEMAKRPMVRLSILTQCVVFASLFITILTSQQSFESFGHGAQFHFWFGGIAILAGSASLINARLVMRLGMRALVFAMLQGQVVFTALMILIWVLPVPETLTFAVYVVWTFTLFFQAGLCIGNLNALAMEPLGHIAGVAASAMQGIATTVAVLFASLVGQSYNGTPLPAAVAILIGSILGVALVWQMTKLERVRA